MDSTEPRNACPTQRAAWARELWHVETISIDGENVSQYQPCVYMCKAEIWCLEKDLFSFAANVQSSGWILPVLSVRLLFACCFNSFHSCTKNIRVYQQYRLEPILWDTYARTRLYYHSLVLAESTKNTLAPNADGPRQSDCRVCLCVYYALWTMKITVLIVIGITATHKHTPFSLFHNFLSTQWTQSQSTLDGKPEGALIYCTLSTGMFNVTQWHFCGIICWFDFIFFLLFHTLCVVQVYKPNNVHSPVLLENTPFFGWHLPFFHHSILTLFRTHIVPFYVCINCKHSSIQVYFINKFRCLFIFRRRELTKANHCASEEDAPNHIALSVCAVRISTTTNMTIFWNYVNFQWES